MPRAKRNVKTLLETCLQNVTRNIEEWCKHYVETYGKEKKLYLYVIGPFDPLPSRLLVRIIDILRDEKRLKKHHLELLITQQLNALDLSKEGDEIACHLRLASIRCPQLKTLKLNGCQKISKQVYQNFLPTFENLQVLDISNTSSGDSCLYVLGAYCKDLRELDVTSCPVTDAGIKGLCLSIDDLGKEDKRLGQCKLIHKLMVSYTKVTQKGIIIALENLPILKVFECCSSVQALAEMHLAPYEDNIPDIKKYSLIDLHCTNESFCTPYKSGSLGLASLLCSSVMKVRIVTQEGLTDIDLLGLLSLENLREFSLGGGEECEITFDGGVAPILEAFGNSLTSLTLAELPCVNIRAITEYCPNLRFLFLVMNHSYTMAWPEEERRPFSPKPIKTEPILMKLESLHLVCVSHLLSTSVIPSESLPSLLSSPQLVHLYVKDCVTLTDEVLKKAANHFQNMEHLELEQCNSITKLGVDSVMNDSNPLRVIKLWECRSLSRQNVCDWNKKANKKKWQVSIEWS